MKYKINVFETENQSGSVKGYANLVFGDSFKVNRIAIMENAKTGSLFVSMPSYKTNQPNEDGKSIYKDICHPTTAEFRKELYDNILKAFEEARQRPIKDAVELEVNSQCLADKMKVEVHPFSRDGSNLKGFVHLSIGDAFAVNNISLFQGREKMYVDMPSYKTNQTNEDGKNIYQDICYPVTADFRKELYDTIFEKYDKALEEQQMNKERTADKEALHQPEPAKEKDVPKESLGR